MECFVHNMDRLTAKASLVGRSWIPGVVLDVAGAWPLCVSLQRWTSGSYRVGSIT